MFEIKDKDLAGRIGVITTRHGKIETPYLFPVINPRKQELSLQDIRDIGFSAIITNAWLINKYYGSEAIERKLHNLLEFDGPIMTDSGAYQELHYGYVEADPIEIVRYQISIGSDISVILDKPTPSNASLSEALESVRETYRRALRVIDIIRGSDNIWVYPIQGAPYIDAILEAVEHAWNPIIYNTFGLYAIGSPTKLLERYDYSTIIRVVAEAKMRLPPDKPVHLFGAGHPMIIPFMVALGIDTFDSASYILYARDERLMTPRGTVRLQELDYLPCVCPICSKYSVKELKKMNKKDRIKLIAKHNLYVIHQELKNVKQAIRENRLWELLEEKAKSHPSLYDAFETLIRYHNYMEKRAPSFKSLARGIFLYDTPSIYRPHVMRHRQKIMQTYMPGYENILFLPLNSHVKKDLSLYVKKVVENTVNNMDYSEVIFYIPFFGLIPLNIIDVYPLFQFEIPDYVSESVLKDLVEFFFEFLRKLDSTATEKRNIYVFSAKDVNWSIKVTNSLKHNINKYLFKHLFIEFINI